MDIYLHVKVLLSMILGLAVAHLLRGVSRIVQHPKSCGLLGSSHLDALSRPLSHPLLVVGVRPRSHPAVDLPSLLFPRHLRHPSLSHLLALLSRRDQPVRRLPQLLLISPPLALRLPRRPLHARLHRYLHQGCGIARTIRSNSQHPRRHLHPALPARHQDLEPSLPSRSRVLRSRVRDFLHPQKFPDRSRITPRNRSLFRAGCPTLDALARQGGVSRVKTREKESHGRPASQGWLQRNHH